MLSAIIAGTSDAASSSNAEHERASLLFPARTTVFPADKRGVKRTACAGPKHGERSARFDCVSLCTAGAKHWPVGTRSSLPHTNECRAPQLSFSSHSIFDGTPPREGETGSRPRETKSISERLENIMKTKLFVLFLAFVLTAWGQTANQPAAPADNATTSAAKCACCEKMATGTTADHKACCHSKQAKNGEMAAMCNAKAGKSCCGDAAKCVRTSANASAAACCSGKSQCGAKGNSCCGESAKMACCGSQCGMAAMQSHDVQN